MDINEAVSNIVELVAFAGRAKDVVALKTIRAALVELGTTHNRQIAPCEQPSLHEWHPIDRNGATYYLCHRCGVLR